MRLTKRLRKVMEKTMILGEFISVGGNNYIKHIQETTKEDYVNYLEQAKEAGFIIYAENVIDESVFCTTLIKDSLILNITYFARENRISISYYAGPISERLQYRESYIADNKADANTKMHMMELFRLGNSFVFQLKNGHFVISDGGLAADMAYLLDYLESLVPEGEKPVIEGWFITHAHGDHCGSFCHFSKNKEWYDRVRVEGVYYSSPSEEEVLNICGCEILDYEIKLVTRRLMNEAGERTKLYRPQTGQRYYFNDITVDILLAQEQVPFGRFRGDLNTSSTVCMFTIEGQKALFSGDIQEEGLDFMMQNYSKEYLNVDFFTLNHHGLNFTQEFAEYINAKTVLLTVRGVVPIRRLRDTKYLLAKAEESMVWGDGTKVLTFPYTVGTYETLPCKEWIYNIGEERLPQRNLYTCPGKVLQGFIFDADRILFKNDVLQQGAIELLAYLEERYVRMAVFSRKSTDEIEAVLKKAGISKYFELILGADRLDSEMPFLDAAQQVEEVFQLDHIYKYVVVCDNLEVVEQVTKDGFKTLVATYGNELDKDINEMRWHRFESLEKIYDYFEEKTISFQ